MTQASRKKNSEYSQHESNLSPHVMMKEKLQDSLGFWILRRRFRIPKPKISDFISKSFQDPNSTRKNVPDSGIRIPLYGAKPMPFGNSPDALPLSFRRLVETKPGACDPCLPIGSFGMVMLANRWFTEIDL